MDSTPKRIIVGISGASGIIYGIRLLEILRMVGVESHLVMTNAAKVTLALETDMKLPQLTGLADVNYQTHDIGAAISSGSFKTAGMVVCPCSMRTLAEIANGWNGQLGRERRFPPALKAWLRECHAGGQKRPTPLLLRYGPGDYNCLHRDLYGDLVFPLQVAILLSEPVRDFTGGEFMLVEQRPRQQSRGEVVALKQGDAVVFAVNERPVAGTRGFHRTAMRHGVSSLREGERFTLGIIFHDAA